MDLALNNLKMLICNKTPNPTNNNNNNYTNGDSSSRILFHQSKYTSLLEKVLFLNSVEHNYFKFHG